MKSFYKDANLEITEKYIKFINDVMPTSALSFFSLHRLKINWWLPILLLLVGLVGYLYFQNDGLLDLLFIVLLIIGFVILISDIIDSRKRFLDIYSHSSNKISIEVSKEVYAKPIITALFEVMTSEDGDANVDDVL